MVKDAGVNATSLVSTSQCRITKSPDASFPTPPRATWTLKGAGAVAPS